MTLTRDLTRFQQRAQLVHPYSEYISHLVGGLRRSRFVPLGIHSRVLLVHLSSCLLIIRPAHRTVCNFANLDAQNLDFDMSLNVLVTVTMYSLIVPAYDRIGVFTVDHLVFLAR